MTTIKRKATALLADLAKDKDPILITEHGRPSAYLADVDSYEKLQAKMALLEGIARDEQAISGNRVLSSDQAKARMARWLKSPGPSPRWLIWTPLRTTSHSTTRRRLESWSSACLATWIGLNAIPTAGLRFSSFQTRVIGRSWSHHVA